MFLEKTGLFFTLPRCPPQTEDFSRRELDYRLPPWPSWDCIFLLVLCCISRPLPRPWVSGESQAGRKEGTYISCLRCHNRVPQTGDLNNRHLFHTFLEARNPRSRCWQVWFYLRPLSLACRWYLLSVSSPGFFSVPAHIPGVYSSSNNNCCPLRLGHTLMISFNLNHLFKGSVSKYSHVLRYRGQSFKIQNSEETQFIS